MKNMKRWTAFVLALLMCLGALAGCASDKTAETQPKANAEAAPTAAEVTDAAEDPFLTGEKPTLRVLCCINMGFDMNADIAKAHMEEITGYKVEYDVLPVENSSEKLMLEIASGADYDLIYRMGMSDYAQLDEKNALMDISDLLEKYGPDILQNATPQMWDQGTHDDGKITGIPYHGGQQADDTLYGMFMGGAAFRTDYLEELGMELPTNLDEFYNVLVAFKDKYGKAPFTSASTGLFSWISSAYGINGGSWYDVDGKLVHMSQLEGFKEYVAFMQKLYREGLLDPDMPINAAQNAKEKFANGDALCTPLYFWDVDSMLDAMKVSKPDANVRFVSCLGKDAGTPGTVVVGHGLQSFCAIPKNAKNPEHAIIWYNAISNLENFRSLYIGEEGVSYQIVNGGYTPIFPAFNDYVNSDKYIGTGSLTEQKRMWMARARKTDAMAVAFEEMNENADDFIRVDTWESYAYTLPALKENMPALESAITDILIKGIASADMDTQDVVDEIKATWDREGGPECEQTINEWWAEFSKTLG